MLTIITAAFAALITTGPPAPGSWGAHCAKHPEDMRCRVKDAPSCAPCIYGCDPSGACNRPEWLPPGAPIAAFDPLGNTAGTCVSTGPGDLSCHSDDGDRWVCHDDAGGWICFSTISDSLWSTNCPECDHPPPWPDLDIMLTEQTEGSDCCCRWSKPVTSVLSCACRGEWVTGLGCACGECLPLTNPQGY